MFLEIDNNPNFEGSYFLRFNELDHPRAVSHIKSYDRLPQGEWCKVTGWCDDPEEPCCPVHAQKVEDSGAGMAFLVYGGNWGIRLKPESHDGDWDLYDSDQWGEGYLLLGDERDIRFT